MSSLKQTYRRVIAGFTLIELLVTLSVIALITGVVVFNQDNFADQLALANATSDLELEIREMQVYGVSVREYQPNSNLFNYSYGVTLNTNIVTGVLGLVSAWSFIDVNANGRYDISGSWATCTLGGVAECLKINKISRGVTISDLCVINSSGGQNCKSSGGSSVPGRIDITFLRPNPDARFYFKNLSGNVVNFANHKGAKIQLRSPKGKTKDIFIYTTGQISIR